MQVVFTQDGFTQGVVVWVSKVVRSPGVAGDGASIQVLVGERVDTGTQPLAPALVHGVEHVQHLVAAHA